MRQTNRSNARDAQLVVKSRLRCPIQTSTAKRKTVPSCLPLRVLALDR